MKHKSWCGRLLLYSGAVFLFLKYLCPVLSPLLAAALFVAIFGPCLLKIQKKTGLPRQWGAILILAVCVTVAGLLLWFFCSCILQNLPAFAESLSSLHLPGKIGSAAESIAETVLSNLLARSVGYAGNCAKFFAFFICFLVVAVMLAKDYDRFMNCLLERQECEDMLRVICDIVRYLATFLRAQAVILTIIALLCGVVLRLLGVTGAYGWGLSAGILDALPFIGTGVVLLPVAVSFFFREKYVSVLICAVLYVTCIFIREILEPKLIGGKVGLPPALVLLAVYGGVKLFGVWGILKGPLGLVIVKQILVGTQSACKTQEEVV